MISTVSVVIPAYQRAGELDARLFPSLRDQSLRPEDLDADAFEIDDLRLHAKPEVVKNKTLIMSTTNGTATMVRLKPAST
jgi:hypothetical protein